MKFLSEDWVNTLVDTLNQDADFKRIGRNWKYEFLCRFQEEDSKKSKGLYLNIKRGICEEAKVVSGEKEAPYNLIGPMSSWMKIFNKESNFFKLVIEQEMQMKGDISVLMENLPTIKVLTKKMAEIPTEY